MALTVRVLFMENDANLRYNAFVDTLLVTLHKKPSNEPLILEITIDFQM